LLTVKAYSWKEAVVTADLMSVERLSNKVRALERPKKHPATRKNDFYGQTKL
jgi:hypothetical protein